MNAADRVIAAAARRRHCREAFAAAPRITIAIGNGDSSFTRWTLQLALLAALEQITKRAHLAAVCELARARRRGEVSPEETSRALRTPG